MAARTRRPRPFPSKEEILAFIRAAPGPVDKKDIARAFHIRGSGRAALKALLRELHADGEPVSPRGRRPGGSGGLPEVAVLQVTEIDPDGELLARPAVWRRSGAAAWPSAPATGFWRACSEAPTAATRPARSGSWAARRSG